MSSDKPQSAAAEHWPPGIRWILWGLLAVAGLLLALEIPVRGIDPDELEHLHAAYCVYRGEIPYRDFFEHHGPAFYYLLQPLFWICGPELSVLWTGRALMWLISGVSLLVAGRLARRWGGPQASLLAMVLLAWTTIFQGKGIELRPDVPAMCLLVLMAGQLGIELKSGTTNRRWLRVFVAGILSGLAMLFTQKSLVPMAGLALGALVARLLLQPLKPRTIFRETTSYTALLWGGIAVVWGTATLWFASHSAANDFWYSTWYQLWIWPFRHSAWPHVRQLLVANFTLWCAAVGEIWFILRMPRQSAEQTPGMLMLSLAAVVCGLSLIAVKAIYPQFFLLWVPLLAILAGRRLAVWCDSFGDVPGKRHKPLLIGLTVLLGVAQLALWARATQLGAGGAIRHLSLLPGAPVVVLLLTTFFTTGTVRLIRRGAPSRNVILGLAALGMLYGCWRNFDQALWSNHRQVAAITTIQQQVPRDGRVLDGFTGYAALRPHAWYYWWLNESSLSLIPREQLETGLLQELQAHPPAAVLYDMDIERLPDSMQGWLRRHYAPAEPVPLWLPRRD